MRRSTGATVPSVYGAPLSRKHLTILRFIQLIKSEHVRFEHISTQLDADASVPQQLKEAKVVQVRLDTLHD
ncbi:unnamed protein product [Rotaria sp. Silwood2]|nr:unnamed protein product [Rotaria sp. Silwood2]CAF2862507.1 unnamed protein product [Rotaria sp. Silwood2]CAF3262296.1 unnamed protein product [Rotaria sp. Silwood2]CAF3325085.1 unnamed protein product [Rotaria sp. Silwood2]CAF4007305.1 unnamed protein product [Rotaria sp. Silwood2]